MTRPLRTCADALLAWVRRGRALAGIGALIGSLLLSGCGGARAARLTTFIGHWQGYSRGMDIFRSGRGIEYIGRGTPRIASLTFEVLRVTGTAAAADARIRVTSVRIGDRRAFFGSLPHKGQIGALQLRRGIITDNITRVYYCAPPIDECDPIAGPDPDDPKPGLRLTTGAQTAELL